MYKIGVFPGKLCPPHRGHLNAIFKAACQCEKLYVVVSYRREDDEKLFAGLPFKAPTLKERAKWLSIELQGFDHIKVIMLDEEGIPSYPLGWRLWSFRLAQIVPEHIDVIFGSEPSYTEGYTKYFPEADYVIIDSERSEFPISATMVRNNPYKYWDYILGAARPHFTKRVLIVGTESCGKTTLTKMLAKIYHTAWAEEAGRYYSRDYLGGNEDVFTPEDFYQICVDQRRLEEDALRHANKVVFFDTEALITQYYCEIYLGEKNPKIESLIDPSRYDLVLFLTPEVKWVDDGLRFISDQKEREEKNDELYKMFIDHGFGDKMVIINGGDYLERFAKAKAEVDKLMAEAEH